MPRKRREWEPGGIYHLTPTGNNKRVIFENDLERHEFLDRLTAIVPAHQMTVMGYCLMDTHLHFLVRCGACGLSGAMQKLLGGYSKWWNRMHKSEGHLFQNRFHDKPVRTDFHLRVAARYIDMNPVEAGMIERPEQWKWSSYRVNAGLEHPAPFFDNSLVMGLFAKTPALAQERYRSYVHLWRPPET